MRSVSCMIFQLLLFADTANNSQVATALIRFREEIFCQNEEPEYQNILPEAPPSPSPVEDEAPPLPSPVEVGEPETPPVDGDQDIS